MRSDHRISKVDTKPCIYVNLIYDMGFHKILKDHTIIGSLMNCN